MPCCSCCPCLECCCEQRPNARCCRAGCSHCCWYCGRWLLPIFYIVAMIIFGVSTYYGVTYSVDGGDDWFAHIIYWSLVGASFCIILLVQFEYIQILFEYKGKWIRRLTWTLYIIAFILSVIAVVLALLCYDWNKTLGAEKSSQYKGSGRSGDSGDLPGQNESTKKQEASTGEKGHSRRKRQVVTPPANDPMSHKLKAIFAGILIVILVMIANIKCYYELLRNGEDEIKDGCCSSSSSETSLEKSNKSQKILPTKSDLANANAPPADPEKCKKKIKVFYFNI